MDTVNPINLQTIYSNLAGDNAVHRARRLLEIGPKSSTDDQLQTVTRQFESLLINQMLSAMRGTVPKSGLLDSYSLQMFESMMDEEIAKVISKERGMGLSEMLYDQLSRAANGQAASSGSEIKL